MPVIDIPAQKFVANAIRRSRRPAAEGDSECARYAYMAPNGRRFEIREYEDSDAPFFVSELRPNGRVYEGNLDDARSARYWLEPQVEELLDDPNGFEAAIQDLGFDREDRGVIYNAGGLGVATIYYGTFEDVANAIVRAISANQWLDSVDRELLNSPEFQAKLREDEKQMRDLYRAEMKAHHEAALEAGSGLFKGLHNMMGEPLPKEIRDRILSFLNSPTQETWEQCYSICVKGGTTLWQAWAKVDSSAPRSRPHEGEWPSIPDAEIIKKALRQLGEKPALRAEDPDAPKPAP